MTRRVKEYLGNLHIETDEDQLREMSYACEPPQGSGKASEMSPTYFFCSVNSATITTLERIFTLPVY